VSTVRYGCQMIATVQGEVSKESGCLRV